MGDDLREKIARVLCEADCGRITENELDRCRGLADAVLDLPEIREGQKLREARRHML